MATTKTLKRKPLADLSNAVGSLSTSIRSAARRMEGLSPIPEGRVKKGKSVVTGAILSCSPVERMKNIRGRGELKMIEADKSHGLSHIAGKKTKKKRPTKSPSSNEVPLPLDFIEKQRAYFAEIDAFELAEEVVSEADED